jgi:membrane-associated phospholipid phosphatase
MLNKACEGHCNTVASRKDGYGMPSSHSCYMLFLWTCVCILLLPSPVFPGKTAAGNPSQNVKNLYLVVGRAMAQSALARGAGIVSLSALAWGVVASRITLQVHTLLQVQVGMSLGVLLGLVWWACWTSGLAQVMCARLARCVTAPAS